MAGVANGKIYTSSDSGASWTPRASNQQWGAIALSSDGTKAIAAVGGGQIWTSTDSGEQFLISSLRHHFHLAS
jgi:hypothetical protein